MRAKSGAPGICILACWEQCTCINRAAVASCTLFACAWVLHALQTNKRFVGLQSHRKGCGFACKVLDGVSAWQRKLPCSCTAQQTRSVVVVGSAKHFVRQHFLLYGDSYCAVMHAASIELHFLCTPGHACSSSLWVDRFCCIDWAVLFQGVDGLGRVGDTCGPWVLNSQLACASPASGGM